MSSDSIQVFVVSISELYQVRASIHQMRCTQPQEYDFPFGMRVRRVGVARELRAAMPLGGPAWCGKPPSVSIIRLAGILFLLGVECAQQKMPNVNEVLPFTGPARAAHSTLLREAPGASPKGPVMHAKRDHVGSGVWFQHEFVVCEETERSGDRLPQLQPPVSTALSPHPPPPQCCGPAPARAQTCLCLRGGRTQGRAGKRHADADAGKVGAHDKKRRQGEGGKRALNNKTLKRDIMTCARSGSACLLCRE